MKTLKLLSIVIVLLSLNACVTGTAGNISRGFTALGALGDALSAQDARDKKQEHIDRQNAQHRTFQLRAMQDQLNQPD